MCELRTYTTRCILQRKQAVMPDVRIQYRRAGNASFPARPYEMQELQELLRQECVERFAVKGRPLAPSDFSIYDEPLMGASTQSHTVIIRITLHHDETRVLLKEQSATELAAMVSEFLNTARMVAYCGRRSVGVSLVFAEIAWAGAD